MKRGEKQKNINKNKNKCAREERNKKNGVRLLANV